MELGNSKHKALKEDKKTATAAVVQGQVVGAVGAERSGGNGSVTSTTDGSDADAKARAALEAKAKQEALNGLAGSWLTGWATAGNSTRNSTLIPVDRKHYSAAGPIFTLFLG